MIEVNFVTADATVVTLEGSAADSAMRVAKNNDVPGILAYCGGNAECGTCHVYVAEDFEALLPPPNEAENATLETVAAERRSNSRLSCQISLVEELSGIELTIPDRQE